MKRLIIMILSFVIMLSLISQSVFVSYAASPAVKSVTLSNITYVYSGKSIKPKITVKDKKNKTITQKGNYKVNYPNAKNVGKYSVTVTFIGKYKKTKSVKKEFTILPRITNITSMTAEDSSVTVKWAKLSANNAGYQLQLSQDKGFSVDSTKTLNYNSRSTVFATVNGLDTESLYYARVRTYKITNNKKYYSAWSQTKQVYTDKKLFDDIEKAKCDFSGAVYYSDINTAISDANALTTQNHDLISPENAEAGLYFDGDNACIILLISIDDAEIISLNNNTFFDLNNCKITFKEGSYLIAKGGLTVINGKISTTNSQYAIKCTDCNKLFIQNTDLESYITDNSVSHVCVYSSACDTIIDCSKIVVKATSAKNLEGIYISSDSKDFNITSSSVDINAESTNGSEIDADINLYNTGDTAFNNCNFSISVGDSAAKTYGIRVDRASNTVINGGKVFCEDVKKDYGNGIIIAENAGEFTINSTRKYPFNVFGKKRGLSTSAKHNYINGGEFYSYDITGYFVRDSIIKNAVFGVKNEDAYNTVFGPDGLCFGGPVSDATNSNMYLYNCTINQPDVLSNGRISLAQHAIEAVTLYGYYAPETINLYNCRLYQGIYHTFYFDEAGANHLSHTRINLYGNTQVYDKSGKAISKDTLASSINTWKNKSQYNKTEGKYFVSLIGDNLICGNVAKVNTSTGEIVEYYITEDANVYDYR